MSLAIENERRLLTIKGSIDPKSQEIT